MIPAPWPDPVLGDTSVMEFQGEAIAGMLSSEYRTILEAICHGHLASSICAVLAMLLGNRAQSS